MNELIKLIIEEKICFEEWEKDGKKMLNCHGSIDNLSIDVLWVTHAFVLFVECSCDILSIGQENLYEWYEGRVNQPVWSYGIETKKEKRVREREMKRV